MQLCGRKLAKDFVRHMASNYGLFITGGLGLIMASLMVYKAISIFTIGCQVANQIETERDKLDTLAQIVSSAVLGATQVR